MRFFRVLYIASVLLALFACESEVVNADLTVPIDEVQKVLKSELFTPPGKLKSVYVYEFEFERYSGRQDRYYDRLGRLAVTLGINGTDTAGVALYSYNATGLLDQIDGYELKNESYVLMSTSYFKYDEKGRVFQVLGTDRKLIATHYYDDVDRLVLKKYGENQDAEQELYEYDHQGRISKFTYMGYDSPIRVLFHHYDDNGMLFAKKTYIGPSLETREMYKYFYDDSNRLVKELEFYPQFDFVQLYKKIYEYYPQSQLSGN